MQHVIELSNKYLIRVSDWGYTVDRLMLSHAGTWIADRQFYCTEFNALIDRLLKCEISSKDIATLQTCADTLAQIRAEFKDARLNEQAFD